MQKPVNPQNLQALASLIDAYWGGEVGDDGLVDLGLRLGMEAHEISHIMEQVRAEDNTL